MPFRYR